MVESLPECIALWFDSGTRRSDRGRTLIGGSPLRVLRVTDAGARVLDSFAAGDVVGASPSRQTLARRLLDAGVAHPLVPPTTVALGDVEVVVPVRNHTAALGRLLDALAGDDVLDQLGGVSVVDDGSSDAAALDETVAGRATVVRHPHSLGPGAARNSGWRATTRPIVTFVDADVVPTAGWLSTLTAHFVDPTVAAVAPRVLAAPPASGATVLDRYERDASPLDRGPHAGPVGPTARVRYVPSAALVVRRDVLEALDGFDPALRFGEDVDLVWRIVAAGHRVRYVPDAVVHHDTRSSWAGLVAQRMGYGSSSAALDRRHRGAVAPVAVAAPTLVAWGLVASGNRRAAAVGVGIAAVQVTALARTMAAQVDDPWSEAVRLGGGGMLASGQWLARATTRVWLPVAVVAALPSRRVARAVAAAVVVPAALEWRATDRTVDLGRWTAARALDDAAYCVGVWRGCRAEGSWRPLRPTITGWGRRTPKWRPSRGAS